MARLMNIFIYFLLFMVTAGYCWFIELAMGAFRILLENWELTCWPVLTEVSAIHPLPWQILAVVSLLINCLLAFLWKKEGAVSGRHTTAAICHICWVLTCFFLHGIGMLTPFIIRAYVIA